MNILKKRRNQTGEKNTRIMCGMFENDRDYKSENIGESKLTLCVVKHEREQHKKIIIKRID